MRKSKGKDTFLAETQVSWFKWEFLRRNEDYQKDYAAFEERFGSWFKRNGYWWSRTGPAYGSDALFFLYSQIGPVANEICRRWDVSDPFDPSWEFDLNGERYEKGSCIGLPSFPYIKGYQIWDFEELDPSLPSSDDERLALLLKGVPDGIERPSWKDTTDRRLIRLEFDVTKSLETNIEELTRRIQLARRRYETQFGSLPDHRQNPRARLDQYDTYLKVWHLRNSGKTFTQIARELHPHEMRNADRLSPAIKRVRSQYDRACRLIAGDYRQIKP